MIKNIVRVQVSLFVFSTNFILKNSAAERPLSVTRTGLSSKHNFIRFALLRSVRKGVCALTGQQYLCKCGAPSERTKACFCYALRKQYLKIELRYLKLRLIKYFYKNIYSLIKEGSRLITWVYFL
jgi:hypothetical protein